MIHCDFFQNKSTPLHYASGAGYTEVVEKLINAGANVNAVNLVSICSM